MNCCLIKISIALLCLALLFPVQTIRAEAVVQMQLEEVVRVEWRQLDEASRYKFYWNDNKLGRSFGGARFFVSDPIIDWHEVRVDAETFGGDPVGTTEVISSQIDQRLVVRWNEDKFDRPFIGLHTRGDGSFGQVIMELTQHPHIISARVESIQRVLFGDVVDRPDLRRRSAPFTFNNGEVESFGPYHELTLP